MSAAKHTPGPWELSRGGNNFVSVDSATVRNIADVWSLDGDCTEEERDANARLIAAAPDLLAFAQEWLERQGADENYMVAKARAAIAKATGGAA